MGLKPPKIQIKENAVVVTLPHEPLAAPETTVLEYLQNHDQISNSVARKLTGIASENSMKEVFVRLRDKKMIERVLGKVGAAAAW